MNFLAHFYLCKEKEHLIVGNFLADVLRGKQIHELPESIGIGIQMHREIDEFTDKHPIVRKLNAFLNPRYARYSSIVVDILFDFLLANHWNQYSNKHLDEYSAMIYHVLGNHEHLFNERAQRLYHYMSTGDWLANYKTKAGINMALNGMSSRASFENNMHSGYQEIENHRSFLEDSFNKFFPDLINFVSQSSYLKS